MWVVSTARGAGRAPGAKADGSTGLAGPRPTRRDDASRPATTDAVIAIIGGLGAAVLWAVATLCSSRSSRMLGSRVVLGLGHGRRCHRRRCRSRSSAPRPATLEPSTLGSARSGRDLLRRRAPADVRGVAHRQGLDRRADRRDRGRRRGRHRGRARRPARLRRRADARGHRVGVVLSSLDPGRPDVAAGDFDIVADAIDEPPAEDRRRPRPTATGSGRSTPGAPTCSCRSRGARLRGRPRRGRQAGGARAGRLGGACRHGWSASSSSSIPLVAPAAPPRHPRGPAPRRHRRRRRGPRLDAVGLGLAREHRDHAR